MRTAHYAYGMTAGDVTKLIQHLDHLHSTNESPGRKHAAALPPSTILASLEANRVRYVLIGGLAAMFYGWPGPTPDVDIVPHESGENLAALSNTIRDMVAMNAPKLALSRVPGRDLNIPAELGLDLIFFPSQPAEPDRAARAEADTRGFHYLAASSADFLSQFGVLKVASLPNIIKIKQIAARPK